MEIVLVSIFYLNKLKKIFSKKTIYNSFFLDYR